ncbi:hypothetical protein PQR63_21500 [Herbaspirillum rhizosphaerae]|uniref:Uncharacterized protein n=1 Tax=Herbaspirillum rhizosphaerae TaxID=346179 RepID=A0ABW8ZCU3_9BURK
MISGLPAGQTPLNDTSSSSSSSAPKITEPADTPLPAVSTQDIDTIVQISPQAQRLAELDAASTTLHNQKEWKQQKKPKTLLDYIEELEVRGRGSRAEAAERRRQQLGNWMPMIAVGDETGVSINVLAKNLAAAAASDVADVADNDGTGLPLPTVNVTRGKQGEELATTTLKKEAPAGDKKSDYLLMLQRLLSASDPALRTALSRGRHQDIGIVSAVQSSGQEKTSATGIANQGKDLKTQLLLAMSDVVVGSGFIKRQLEMLHVAIRRRQCNCHSVGVAHINTSQIDARFLDDSGNPDLSKMLGAVLNEQIKDKSSA